MSAWKSLSLSFLRMEVNQVFPLKLQLHRNNECLQVTLADWFRWEGPQGWVDEWKHGVYSGSQLNSAAFSSCGESLRSSRRVAEQRWGCCREKRLQRFQTWGGFQFPEWRWRWGQGIATEQKDYDGWELCPCGTSWLPGAALWPPQQACWRSGAAWWQPGA